MATIPPVPDKPQPKDVWPVDVHFTVAICLPILFWLGFLAGWFGRGL